MKLDEPFSFVDGTGTHIDVMPIELCIDKRMYLLLGFVNDYNDNKQYLRFLYILINGILLTTRFADTQLAMSEIKLFTNGSKRNKFFDIAKLDGEPNLLLKCATTEKPISIDKHESLAIVDTYNLARMGYSTKAFLQKQIILDPQELTKILHSNQLLSKKKKLWKA
jgi:hypothetical protein